jgi:DNA-binding HxlR family transcriptional regulator
MTPRACLAQRSEIPIQQAAQIGRLFISYKATTQGTETMTSTRAVTAELTLKIVAALRRGPLRFNEIDRAVNAPNHPTLSERLKKMVRDGLIERRVHKLGPPANVSYELTKLGADFAQPATALIEWTRRNANQIEAARQYHQALAARS